LPGLLEQVQSKGLFVSFPDENAQPPSKSELKKLAKLAAAKEKKQAKAGGAPAGKEETKGAAAPQGKGKEVANGEATTQENGAPA
jgi:hypothetical protein